MAPSFLAAAFGLAALATHVAANSPPSYGNGGHGSPHWDLQGGHSRPTKSWHWTKTRTHTSTSISGTATSTATGTSTGTFPPGPTNTGDLPLVNSEGLQGSISESALSDLALELQAIAYDTPERNRVMGSLGFNNTIEWIEDKLDALGDYYTYYRQPFTALFSRGEGNLTVDGVDYSGEVFEYSVSGDVTAAFVPVANLGCDAADFPADVSGNLALISRGTCPFGQKVALAGAAGAAGAVIYNNAPGPVGGGTLGEPPRPEGPYVAAFGISQENGTALLDAIAAGQSPEGTLLVEAETYNTTVFNVIAQTTGGDQNNVLAMGAHADSVYAGPGINDDGSGTIALLEIAKQLTQYRTNNAVRLCWWGGEEYGLLGSTYYVSQLSNASISNIRLYENFDMIASPNYIYAIYDGDGSDFNITGPTGSAQAEAFFEDFFTSRGLNYTSTAFDGRSDYGPFLDAGIAAAGLFTGAEEEKTEEWQEQFGGTAGLALDPNYHQPGDNYTNLNFEAFLVNTQAIAASVAEYGVSFASLGQASARTKRYPHLQKRGSLGKGSKCHHQDLTI